LIGAIILISIFIYFTPKILKKYLMMRFNRIMQYSNQRIDKGFTLLLKLK